MPQPSRSDVAARTFRLDVKGAEIRRTLAAAGVRSILLKGRAFANLLYDSPTDREYSDVDLLIESRSAERAARCLLASGFEQFDVEAPSTQTDPGLGVSIGALGALHGGSWIRSADGFVLDVHTSLPQVTSEPARVWQAMTAHVESAVIGGAPTEILDAPASAFLVSMHAAHHGPKWAGSLGDLHAAVERLPFACWQEAHEIAVELGAEGPFGVGLGILPKGATIAARLGLATEPSPALRLLWAGAPWSASFLDSVARAPGVRARASLIARLVLPPPDVMRRGSALARRGPAGLLAAYLTRPVRLAARLPAAIKARRRLGSDDDA